METSAVSVPESVEKNKYVGKDINIIIKEKKLNTKFCSSEVTGEITNRQIE